MGNNYNSIVTDGSLADLVDRYTDDFDSVKTEELETQWKHKISVIPESEGITTKWWDYTAGVSRVGPEAQVPPGETITTNQSGEYIVGTPALAGGAARVEGTAQAGDDWWTGYTDRLGKPAADDNGVGIGYKYFNENQGDLGGAKAAGEQEYVWFRSGVGGVDDLVIPRDRWNGDRLDDFTVDLSKGNLFHRGGFVRIDHTFYNHGSADVNFGIKTANGQILIKTLHSFNAESDPMWSQSDLFWQMGTLGANLTGYINAAHYKAGNGDRIIRFNGTGRDGGVLGGATGAISQGTPIPLISIRVRSGWENVNVTPIDYRVRTDGSYYVFMTVGADLTDANFTPPNSETPEISPPGSEYAVEADNEATAFTDIGDVEALKYVGADGQGSQSSGSLSGEPPDMSLSEGEIATLGVIPVGMTAFEGASLEWGVNF